MLKVPDKEIRQSIQHIKEGKVLNNNLNTRSTLPRFTVELDEDIISFNKFVCILAVAAARWLEVESKLGLLAVFNLDWTVSFLGRIHQHRETCGNRTPRMFKKSRNSRRFRRFKIQKSTLATLFLISPDCVPHMEKVFSIVRKIYDRKPTDNLKDLDVNTAIWCRFMSVTLQAAVHLGRDYSLNSRSVKNQSSKCMEHLFRTTEKLIKEQTEITGLSTIYWDQAMWREPSLLCDGVVRIMKSKTYVFSDSVRCFAGISPEAVQAWKDKINGYLENTLSQRIATYALRCWSDLGPGCEKMWYGTHVNKPNGEWNRLAEIMMINFAEMRAS